MARNLNSTTSNKYIMFASYVKLSLYSVSPSIFHSCQLSFWLFEYLQAFGFLELLVYNFQQIFPLNSTCSPSLPLCSVLGSISSLSFNTYMHHNTHKFHTLTEKRLFRCDEMSAPFHCALIASFIRLTNKTHRSSGI